MEHYFRTGLWIFVLIGCLQAAPVTEDSIKNLRNVPMADFRFELLEKFTCNDVTFKSPNNASGSCTTTELIVEGLNKANSSCQCVDCIYVLELFEIFKVSSTASKSSACTSEVEGSLTFQDFVKKFKTIVQQNKSG